MIQQSNSEQPTQASNERAVVWARQMMAHKRAEQKRMAEEYENDPAAQALVAELFQRNKRRRHNDGV